MKVWKTKVGLQSNLLAACGFKYRASLLYDVTHSKILYSKNADVKCYPASTTKIMTAIVVIENANLTDTVTVSSKAAQTGGSRLGLSTGNTITVENLLYGLMMRSR